jgi:predicted glycogen debranching enzyme
MAIIQFDRNICGNLDEALKHEWLETNGMGGFASSTVAGANTRRYHGLLIAATQPPAVRHLLLAKMEETLIVGGQRCDLSVNLYPGTVHPAGYRYLTGFRLDPFPVFTFEAGGVEIEKRVFMPDGENTVVIEYETASYCRLELRPLIAFRGYHDLTQANQGLNGAYDESAGLISIQPYLALPRLWFAHNANSIANEGHWYFNFEYPLERQRGLDFHEDLYCPFMAAFDLKPGEPAVLIASMLSHNAADAAPMRSAEIARRAPATDLLTAAADHFVVRRGPHRTVIAGYPWFSDWSRDTMISLPGLALATGRYDIARDVLLTFAGYIDQGMLPNRFPDSVSNAAQPLEYNTADATLWFFEAIRQYLEHSGDSEFVRAHLYEKLKDIISWHARGTRFGIRVDSDGLLNTGDPSTSLTWMDARVGGKPVTPRNGKPVEIQALWYNALRFVAKLAVDFADEDARVFHENLAEKAAVSFNQLFWDPHAGHLYDVVYGDTRDLALRPNQVISLSLGYCAIPEDRARRILEAVERHLLTPFGLRTLSPQDPHYYGRYGGSPQERDTEYHQGPVWPWLLGPFITADVRFNGDAARGRIAALLEPLRSFAASPGTGQLPELFEGDSPHAPRGCFAQAWSVAEILRVSTSLR